MTEHKKKLFEKLLEVKKKVPYLQMDKDSYQYSYATPSLVLGTFNPLLNEAGILLKTEVLGMKSERVLIKSKHDKEKFKSFKPQVKDNKGNTVDSGQKEEKFFIDVYETLYSLEMRFTWVDTATGETDENLFFSSGLNGDEKGVGSALTYAERYFFLKYFNVPTDKDDPDSFQEKHLSDEQKETIKKQRVIDEWAVKLKKCETLEKLGGVYSAMGNKIQPIHEKLKNELKEKLSK